MTIVASAAPPPASLTPGQAAAAAKIAFAVETPGAVAVLCGPAGVGKTTVLRHLADAAGPAGRAVRVATLAALEGGSTAAVAEHAGGLSWSDTMPDVLLVDDAHEADVAGLTDLLARCRRCGPAMAVVLAGQGRLLSLVAGDARLAQSIRLRATLPVFSFGDTCRLLAGRPIVGSAGGSGEAVLRTIHEISGGVPAVSLRLAEVADMLAAATPRPITADDIEIIHRRLSLLAA
jgi:energy-coupling factor transporter ATP-binding protein EcfA2